MFDTFKRWFLINVLRKKLPWKVEHSDEYEIVVGESAWYYLSDEYQLPRLEDKELDK